jgi:hypothetical protein
MGDTARVLHIPRGILLCYPPDKRMDLCVERGIAPHHRRSLTPDGRTLWVSWVFAGPTIAQARVFFPDIEIRDLRPRYTAPARVGRVPR